MREARLPLLQLLGAGYLIWLGASMLWRSWSRHGRAGGGEPGAVVAGGGRGFRAGMLTNLLNPKVGLFYLSLLPQFLPAGPGAPAWGALLVALHVTIGIGWLGGVVLLADRARRMLLQERRWRSLIWASGTPVQPKCTTVPLAQSAEPAPAAHRAEVS